MKTTGGNLLNSLILFVALLATLVVIYIGYRLQMTPSVDSPLERWVNIGTVITAISSVIIGIATIVTMRKQNDAQEMQIRYQKMEHQPFFIVKAVRRPYQKDGQDVYCEEVEVFNYGYKSFAIENIKISAFVQMSRTSIEEGNKEYRMRMYDYFGIISYIKDDNNQVASTHMSHLNENLENYLKLYNFIYSQSSDKSIKSIILSKDILVKIEYKDVYEEERAVYFQNGMQIDESHYNEFVKNKECASVSIKTLADSQTVVNGFLGKNGN